jgi:hypothetical protein
MSADPLPFDALQWWVSVALGKPDPHAFSQLLMCPDRGCVTLVSARSFLLHTSGCSWFLRPGFSPLLQEVGWHKPSLPRVPQVAVDRAARRVAAEEKKKKKDTEKARARERRRARDALEKLRRRQEREGLPREPSPETPDDDDDDEDDDEEDDMAARLGLSPDLGFGQEPSSQSPESGRRGPGPRAGGNPRGYLTPRLEELRRPRGARPGRLLPESRRSRRQRRGATLRSPWQCLGNPPPGRPGRSKQRWCRSCRRSGPRRRFRGPRPKRLPPRHGGSWPGAGKYLGMSSSWLFIHMSRP